MGTMGWTMDMQLWLVFQGLLAKAENNPPTDGNRICIVVNTALMRYTYCWMSSIVDMMLYLYEAGFAKKDINCSHVQIKKGFNFFHRNQTIPTETKQDLHN